MRQPSLRLDSITHIYAAWLLFLSTTGQYTELHIQCFSCSSHIDPSCARGEPRVTITCRINNGMGCSTVIHEDGRVEKGCSQIGLNPPGCQISELVATECVCHNDLCNEGIPAYQTVLTKNEGLIECYFCDSNTNPWCGFELPEDSNIPTQTCPAHNGCYYTKRVDDGDMLYHRLCFDDGGPAAYYPGGCYTVYNDQTATSSEICVCYDNLCNRNSRSVYASSTGKGDNSNSGLAITFSFITAALTLGLLVTVAIL